MPDITALLADTKDELNVTWAEEDKKITGYINQGMSRLQEIAGATLDFEVAGLPRSLLFGYCRYARSQVLEMFEKNFQSELLSMHIKYQVAAVEEVT